MGVNLVGQGRHINVGTTSNNLDQVNTTETINQQVKLPVMENEKSSKDMDHGKEQQKSISEKDIKTSADKLNKFLQGEATHVEYERHDKLKNEFVIKIIDNNTKEVIKEIPPKKS